jgi:hypothetical protein
MRDRAEKALLRVSHQTATNITTKVYEDGSDADELWISR